MVHLVCRRAVSLLNYNEAWDDTSADFIAQIRAIYNFGDCIAGTAFIHGDKIEVLVKGKLPEIRFHALRHPGATLHLMTGTNPPAVAQILWHSTIQISLST